MADYIRLLIVGDVTVAKEAAKQRGIKVRSACPTGFYTALYVDNTFSTQADQWFAEFRGVPAPFPTGMCTFISPTSKIVYQS